MQKSKQNKTYLDNVLNSSNNSLKSTTVISGRLPARQITRSGLFLS